MGKSVTTFKFVSTLLLLLSFSGVAHGYYSGVYLYCTNKDDALKGYAYNDNGFKSFVDQHGTSSGTQGIKNTVLNDQNYLYIYTDNRIARPARLMDENNQSNNFDLRGYLIFDNVHEAKTFCDGLSNFCIGTFGEEYKYAVGARNYLSGYYGLSVIYKEINWKKEREKGKEQEIELKSSVCPIPRYETFPNNGGDIPY